MSDIVQSFEYTAEGVTIILKFIKEISPFKSHDSIRFFIDAEIISSNQDLMVEKFGPTNSSNSIDWKLLYQGRVMYWMSFNPYHGLRWKEYSQKTGILSFKTASELKECYIKSMDYIPLIADYFYKCVSEYKKLKDLYETEVDKII